MIYTWASRLKGEKLMPTSTSIIKLKGKKNKYGLQGYIVRINRKINGKYLPKDKTIYGKEEAEDYKLKLDTKANNSSIDRFTFMQIYDKFIESKKLRIKERSVDRIKQDFDLYIIPTFKNCCIDEITPVMIEDWMQKLDTRELQNRDGLLAATTKRNIYGEFKNLFEYAFTFDYITKNPFLKIKNFRKTDNIYSKTDFYIQGEATLFLQTARGYAEKCEKENNDLSEWNYYVWFALAIGTGARRGEIHGFQWNDIFEDTIYVRRGITQKKKYSSSTSVKTANAIRQIPLSKALKQILDEHKKRMIKIKGFNEEFRICNNIKNSTIERRRDQYSNAANLKIIRLHDFRHSFVSHLYFANVDDDIIKEYVGHSTKEMTEHYKHIHPLKKAQAKQIIANMIL